MSVHLENVCKTFRLQGASKTIAHNITLDIPQGRSIALLGRNGTGKSSLLQMIAGAIQPDSGEIVSQGSVSWPVGFQGSFHRDLTGAQNAKFLARVYGVETRELLDFVADFAELGAHFHQPVRTYSSGMRSRLGFACSMGIHFDVYLVDEVTAVGDAAFKRKSEALFMNRLQSSGALFVSHSMPSIRRVCDAGAVLENGRLQFFDDVEEAINRHERNMLVR
ncbi:ABC transporter ATP-binding protein [Phaeobacter gallaeciensis]|uniref:ABC transporter ATP-binding protein n=2 Tax=Roseobacteraceae TaxID=2854170 RepID=A0A366WQD9_9RHOB|nr:MULTISPECIES: ABC transporter ATP-binding protein [Roseobacteraceae]MBT3140044.1 ABC transporter ATP-binding protein [Falsiruegeria litorea]MBT8167236.1 ABC transporter ATP-binding protein [Falsiruegeria litorea]RBW52438.1 ABC transporter ATP-binding protein [Phaeobacter gallaeciensis]